MVDKTWKTNIFPAEVCDTFSNFCGILPSVLMVEDISCVELFEDDVEQLGWVSWSSYD